MDTTFQSLGLDKLSQNEKIALVHDLSEELEATIPQSSWLTVAQREELRRRIADMDSNPDTSIPWEEVEAEIQRRFSP